MREIVEVGLKDFQSHKNTVVNFESGFNVIVGASDSGKTAIKRGIESVLYNKYVGAEYIREGQKSFSNYVLFNDGLRITREKGGRGLNRYLIEYPNGEKLELNNFGVKVPQEVLDAHGMYLVELGKEVDSLNCAYQLAGPFFLQNTSGERAAIIGSIAKTQIIDEAVSDTMSKHREQRKELKALQTTNKQIESELSTYNEWIDEAKILLENIEKDYEELNKCIEKHTKLNSTISSLENNEVTASIQRNIIEMYNDIYVQESKLLEIISKFNDVKVLENKYNRLNLDIERKNDLEIKVKTYDGIDETIKYIDEINALFNKYNSISNKVSLIEQYTAKKNNLENIIESFTGTDDVLKNLDILEKDIVKYSNLIKKMDALEVLYQRKAKGMSIIDSLSKNIEESISKYQNALDELGVCPVCYSVITEEQFRNIKSNLE